MRILFKLVVALLLLSALSYFTYKGYDQSWTGFQGYTNNKSEFVPPKKLWDWFQLLIVPILIAFGVWWLNKSQKNSDQKVETDRQRQRTLEDYFNYMTTLLLKEHLRDSTKNKEARILSRTRTLSVLRSLDGDRKGQVIQFLYESGLIYKNPIVRLTGANLRHADLNSATLIGAEIRGVYLHDAQLKGVNLLEADLRGSVFYGANLSNADMTKANLIQAVFAGAKLTKADLTGATLVGPELKKAKSKRAKLQNLNRC